MDNHSYYQQLSSQMCCYLKFNQGALSWYLMSKGKEENKVQGYGFVNVCQRLTGQNHIPRKALHVTEKKPRNVAEVLMRKVVWRKAKPVLESLLEWFWPPDLWIWDDCLPLQQWHLNKCNYSLHGSLCRSISSCLGVFVGLAASLAINRPCSAGWFSQCCSW